ncbi:MAG: serine/threonine-protein kinase [Acidobacteriota bacterium]
MIGEKLGPYEILEEIGRGGMGIVFRAYQPSLDREIAIKILPSNLVHDKELVQRFLREARSAAKLDHPNIVTIHDVGEHEGTYYLAMQLVEGKGLDQIIMERGPLQEDESLSILSQIADALGHAHGKGIIHRDVKSANILIDQSGRVVITDFGIARALTDTRITRQGQVSGVLCSCPLNKEEGKREITDPTSIH